MNRRSKRRREPVVPRYLMPATGYRERQYQRPALQRLTPLAWFMTALVVLALIGLVVVVVNRVVQGSEETELLSERLAKEATQQAKSASGTVAVLSDMAMVTSTLEAQKVVSAIETQTPAPTREVTAQPPAATAVQVTSSPTVRPLPSPTFDVNGAPWQDQLVLQPDGTLQAPEEVLQRARADLSQYYEDLRDLPLEDYLAKRDTLLKTYFTGAALEEMQKPGTDRLQYLKYRSGEVSIEVRDFSSNGLAATAGIRMRGWVNDVYEVASKELLVEGRVESDTFSVVRILFDRASQRWKFAIVKQVTEVTRP